MSLIITNLISSDRSYLSGAVVVPASTGVVTVSATLTFPISRDAQLVYDANYQNVSLSDGVNSYIGYDAVAYLNQIALSIGGAVVGLAGSTAPSYEITVGGKDSAGKSQPARMNQFSDIAINFRNSYSNITGNTTSTVKSASGTLHAIMINDNTTNGVVTIYDNAAASGTKIATLQIGTPSGGLLSTSGQHGPQLLGPLGLEFTNGLTVVTSGSTSNNVTVIYQ